jgi:glycosyltransferase involved in cell wall biosynthesis
MKILYICGDIGVEIGGRKGAATHVRETCHAMMHYGNEVRLVTPMPGDLSQVQVPVTVVPPPVSKWIGSDMRYLLLNRSMRAALKREISSFRPDAVYERYSLYQTAGQELCNRFDIPRILEVNTLLAKEQARRLHWPWLAQRVESKLWRREKAIICISQMLKRLMTESAGIKESEMTGFIVSPVAVNPNIFTPDTLPVDLDRFGLKGKKIVGYMGTMTSWHGVDLFFDAARMLKERNRDVLIFAVGGEADRLEKLRAKVHEQGLESHLRFHGSIPFTDVPSYLRAMDVCLIADTQDWSSPTKFFEFAAMERTVVAGRSPAVEEVFGPEKNTGLLFERGNVEDMVNQILNAVDNPELSARFGKNARRRVLANYTWRRNISTIMSLYQKLGAANASMPPPDSNFALTSPLAGSTGSQ